MKNRFEKTPRACVVEPLEARVCLSGDYGFGIGIGSTEVALTLTSAESAYDTATDAAGNVYVAGVFQGVTDFNPSPAKANNLTSLGERDAYLAKYSPTGAYVWAIRIGGAQTDAATSVVVDGAGNVTVGGTFVADKGKGVDADPSAKTHLIVSKGGQDGFVATYSAAGKYLRSLDVGGKAGDTVNSIAVDSKNNLLITGGFTGTTVIGAPTPVTLTTVGPSTYLAKVSPTAQVVWANSLRGTAGGGYTEPAGVAVGPADSVVVSGDFSGAFDFRFGKKDVVLTSPANRQAGFAAKYDLNGVLVWARQLAGNKTVTASGLAVDRFGGVITTGRFTGTVDFNPGKGVASVASSGGNLDFEGRGGADAYISKLDTNGLYVWAKRIGAASADETATAVVTDKAGNVYATGTFHNRTDFDPGAGVTEIATSGSGGDNGFLEKLTAAGDFVYARAALAGATSSSALYGLSLDKSGSIFMAGLFSGSVDVNPGAATVKLTSTGDTFYDNSLLIKLTA